MAKLTLPENDSVKDVKPSNHEISGNETVYLENKVIKVGTPMGLLLALTYPTTINFVGPRI